ncbi:MAG: bacteriohemerythrin [Limisphaerales bacterium]
MSLQWKDEFLVSVPQVDLQHRKLIEMIGDLEAAMRVGKGKEILGKTLAGVVEYTQYHFSTEERLMADNPYPEGARHKDEHRKLIKTVGDFRTQFDQGAVALTVPVMTFLQDWLVNHILHTDKAMGRHLTAAGLRT